MERGQCRRVRCAIQILMGLQLLLLATPGFAESHGEFRAILVSGQRVDGSACELDAEWLRAETAGGSLQIPRADLRLLEVRKGNRTKAYALTGGLCGAMIVGLAILEVQSDPTVELRGERVLPMLLGFTGLGLLFGGAVGSQVQSWERLDLEPSLGTAMTPELRIAWRGSF